MVSGVLKHHVTEENPVHEYDIEVTTTVDRNATVAVVTFYPKGGVNPPVYATGSAKRAAGDKQSDIAGAQLAVGRALIALGQEFVHDVTTAIDAVYEDE